MIEDRETPDWLRGVISRPEDGFPFSDPYLPIVDLDQLVERDVRVEDLLEILFRRDVQANFQALAAGTEAITLLERLATAVQMPQVERVPRLRERSFVVFGNIAVSDIIEVSPVEEGGAYEVKDSFIPTLIETAFEIFSVHSEPGFSQKTVVIPSGSGRKKLGGDLFSLATISNIYEDEGLTIRPISILVRPDQGKAMFLQVKEGAQIALEMMEEFEVRTLVDQGEANAELEKMGFNVALVKFPLEREELEKALEPFKFRMASLPEN